MNEDQSRKRLGRGLAALIGEMDKPSVATSEKRAESAPRPDRTVDIGAVMPNPANPRRVFTEDEIADLAASIRQHGIVQPIVVRPSPRDAGTFEIIAGERRWRAAQRAGIGSVPVIVREADDKTALEIAIVENVQRADLNPVEEAAGYQSLIDHHGYTQNELAEVIGKSRSHVANTLRLLKLPQSVRTLLEEGSLSAGHARALITASDPLALAKRIIADGLSVRQAEALAQEPASGTKASARQKAAPDMKDADTLALEKLLTDVTGLKVAIQHGGNGGELRIRYKTLEQLDALCRRLQA